MLDPILLPWPFEASSCNLRSSYLSLLIVRAKMTTFKLLFCTVVWLDWSGRLMPILQLFSCSPSAQMPRHERKPVSWGACLAFECC